MNTARVAYLFERHITGHSVDTEILSKHVSLQLDEEMRRYFEYIQLLLAAIETRVDKLMFAAVSGSGEA